MGKSDVFEKKQKERDSINISVWWNSMSSKHFLIIGVCLITGFIGIERTIYWLFFLATFIFGFVWTRILSIFVYVFRSFSFILHLLINKKLWLKSTDIYNRIKTSFIQSKLITHLRDITGIDFQSSRSNERAPLTGISDIDEPIYEVNS
jgi:hypothetical protein